MKPLRTGGGWPAIRYAWKMARQTGGLIRFLKALQSKNACKTCALGMGGQRGGMVDEAGRFPEVCKKSMQAMAADMRGRIQSHFFERFSIAALRQWSPKQLEDAGRLVDPVYASPDDTHFRAISWDDALTHCIKALRQTPPNENFFYASGRSSNEAGFLLQLFARLYGTNNVNNCSYYCHQASAVGLTSSLGSGTATIELEDLEQCDLVFLIGGNPASNHPRLMRQLMALRRRGGEVIVINPLKETGLVNFSVPSDFRSLLFGSSIATIYLQPHIGGDLALLTGLAKRIIEADAVDRSFVDACTEGFFATRDQFESTTWNDIVQASGVDRSLIEQAAQIYLRSERTVFAWTMGITHHLHGVDNVRAMVNLALLRGMVGKPGAGLLPIRGHSNVQGIGSVGVTPALKDAVFREIEKRWPIRLPTSKGMDTLSCMEAMHRGEIRGAWCLGGNLYGANPDARFAAEAFSRIDHVAYLSTALNTGHVHGRGRHTLILPVLPRDEEQQPTTQESMFNFVRLSDGGPARHSGPRGEVEVIARIAHGVLGDDGPIDWRSMENYRCIREAIGAVIPGFEPIAAIDATREEFQISGRTLHRPVFSTPSGKAKFHALRLPEPTAPAGTLRLMTLRSEGQFNTVVYEEEDIYRHQERRDVILMNADDMTAMGLIADQPVTVRSSAGEMKGILVRPFDIRAGNAAMYYPEANVLVPRDADPESRTPAFKHVEIGIHK